MKKILLFVLICCSWFNVSIQAHNDGQYTHEFLAKVEYVTDGDTLVVRDENGHRHKIRIANIDAPELKQANGQKSRENILYLTNEKINIKLRYLDKYKREVSDVFYHNEDIGLKQIKDGYAWVYKIYAEKYLPEERLDLYYQAETSAKLENKGLWANRNAIPPWVFRQNLKNLNGSRKMY